MREINRFLINLGVTVVGSIGIVIWRDNSALENSIVPAQDLGQKLIKSIRTEIKSTDQDEINRQRKNIFAS